MKLTKKLEAEVLKTYQASWDALFRGDIKTFASLLDDHVVIYGSAAGEVFTTKKAAVKFYIATADQITGKVDLRKRKIGLKAVNNTVVVHELCELFFLTEQGWVFYGPARITDILEKKGTTWKIIHHHTSFPDSRTIEGEQFATEKIKAENLLLRDAVQRRTVELEHKNRELEIETALEKVRTVAMAMKKADDMLSVCKTISQQLVQLGVKEIRNVQTAIFYEGRGTYMNYEYYAKHTKTFITEVEYKNHKIQLAFAKKMMKGPNEEVLEQLKGKKLQDWYAYQKTTNQFADNYLLKADSLNYYWYSLGPVALGISTYYPLTKDETILFKRFLKVFELAYRRYLDIEQATAQAKEAQIEAALERIRARALAMHQSEEFTEVAKVMREQMGLLGQPELETSAVHLYNEDADHIFSWRAFRLSSQIKGNISYGFFKIPKTSCAIAKEFVEKFKSRATDYTIEVSGAKQTAWYKVLFMLAPEVADAMKKSGTTKEKRYYHFSKFTGGALLMVSSKEPANDAIELQKRSAQVFDLAYRRFKDLQKAEAQAREAQIEAALERIRAASLAMQDSSALSEIIYKLYGELTKLDAKLDRCFIMIVHPENKGITWWMAGQEGLLAENGFFVQMNQHHSHLMYLDYCKKRKKKWTYLFEGKEKKDWDKFGFSKTELTKLPEPIKEFMAAAKKVHLSGSSDQFGSLVTGSFEPLPEEKQEIISRFTIAFNQAYTRFLDLQKAEAQTREAQIEAALERVRSRSMAMHTSQELKDVALELRKQMGLLGQKDLEVCAIHLYDEENSFESWSAMRAPGKEGEILQTQARFPKKGIRIVDELMHHKNRGSKDYVLVNDGEKIAEWFKVMKVYAPELHASIMHAIGKVPVKKLRADWSVADFSGGALIMVTYGEPDVQSRNLLRRSANVFEQAYIRFLDLQKAEAQAREAEIELALERVRARTMAMQHSNELPDAANVLFKQIQSLGMPAWSAGYCTWNEDKSAVTLWMSSEGVLQPPFTAPTTEDALFIEMRKGWEDGKAFHAVEMGGNKLVKHYQYMRTLPVVGEILDSIIAAGHPLPTFQIMHHAYFSKGFLLFITYEPVPKAHDIFKRFGKVFDQTYTRFLDLQKAEAQAREAQIEAALERVRSRTMAMHKSEDLSETSVVLFNELNKLGIQTYRSGFGIYDEVNQAIQLWLATISDQFSKQNVLGTIPLQAHYAIRENYTAWKEKKSMMVHTFSGKEVKEYYKKIGNYLSIALQKKYPDRLVFSVFFFSEGSLNVMTDEPLTEDDNKIMLRFSNVFGLTYRRFLDLQKAEAQAREAQIEASLERVRSRSMGMQKSEELKDVIKVVYEQLVHVNIKIDHAGFVVDYTPKGDWTFWIADEQDIPAKITHPYFESVWSTQFNNANEKGEDLFVTYLNFEEKNKFYNELLSYVPGLPQASKDFYLNCPALAATTVLLDNVGLYIENFDGIPYADEENKILMRFGKVFQQTYTRFLDLQKAEAQARESQIEASLEKVRSRSLAMQKPEELLEVAEVLRSEMGHLGVEELETSSIYLVDKENEQAECWYAIKDIREEHTKLVSDDMNITFAATWVGNEMWKFYRSKKEHISIVMKGENRKEWINYCAGVSNVLQGYYGNEIPERTYHLVKFNGGYMGAASPGDISAESWDLLRRAAAVFSLAYTRFNDLQIAEAHALQAEQDLIAIKEAKQKVEEALTDLQAAQKQLIQSEKMASLGELTAGIAHEIQNPLNFVNNFSEVSAELIREMVEEVDKGNTEEVKAIADDVVQNLEKINHHGKRAADIVKGMLQHSRSSSGVKEPTNINALADEYLRLAYHGLRAKDKTFNATMKTDFDDSIGNISIIPQEIGRVILNLITNAFYVVDEKSKAPHPPKGGDQYEPTVTITTASIQPPLGGRVVQIKVSDNGGGIPQKILDKIFQPFFTTKPTGQGTGLGLSLSYDIVKAHGGELKVETKEGEGSEFIVVIPV